MPLSTILPPWKFCWFRISHYGCLLCSRCILEAVHWKLSSLETSSWFIEWEPMLTIKSGALWVGVLVIMDMLAFKSSSASPWPAGSVYWSMERKMNGFCFYQNIFIIWIVCTRTVRSFKPRRLSSKSSSSAILLDLLDCTQIMQVLFSKFHPWDLSLLYVAAADTSIPYIMSTRALQTVLCLY